MVEHQTSGTFVLVVGRVMRYLICCTGTADLYLAVLKAIFNLFLGPPRLQAARLRRSQAVRLQGCRLQGAVCRLQGSRSAGSRLHKEAKTLSLQRIGLASVQKSETKCCKYHRNRGPQGSAVSPLPRRDPSSLSPSTDPSPESQIHPRDEEPHTHRPRVGGFSKHERKTRQRCTTARARMPLVSAVRPRVSSMAIASGLHSGLQGGRHTPVGPHPRAGDDLDDHRCRVGYASGKTNSTSK